MNLHVISIITTEIIVFLIALKVQKQEFKLFHFLNGLDDAYDSIRSKILI